MLAIGVILAWFGSVFGIKLHHTIWIILVAYLARYLSFSMKSASASLQQVNSSLEEASRACGATHTESLKDITLPLIRPAMVSEFFLIFLPAMRELTAPIRLCGRLVSIKSKNLYVPPEERGLGMVFQAFAVWPHMNIFDNVAFPLKIQKVNKADMVKRVKEALHHCSLDGLEEVYPSELSGGQQQRKFNFTIIFVIHDQSEAMAISDWMMVCDMGRIMQIDTPENLYRKPNSRFVHSFLGESTFINVDIVGGKAFPQGDHSQALELEAPKDAAGQMVVAARPNAINMTTDHGFKTHVEKRIFLTDKTEYLVAVGEQLVKVETPHRVVFAPGEACCIEIANTMWYPAGDREAEEERVKRQLV